MGAVGSYAVRRLYHAIVTYRDQAQLDWLIPPKKRGGGLPVVVPGARGRRKGRAVIVDVPDHGVGFVDAILRARNYGVSWLKGGNDEAPLMFDVHGRMITDRLIEHGLLKPEVLTDPDLEFRPHQLRALGIDCWAGSYLDLHGCGAGKTLVAILWSLWMVRGRYTDVTTAVAHSAAPPRHTVLITRVPAIYKMEAEVAKWCGSAVQTALWLPPSDRRKSYREVPERISEASASRAPLIVIVGQENVPAARLDICPPGIRPACVIFDEIHKLRSWRRWTPEKDEDGEVTGFTPKLTSGAIALQDAEDEAALAEGRTPRSMASTTEAVRAWAMMKVSRAADYRLGLTASFIPNRRRDIWAQIDLVFPQEAGGFYNFATRYCAGHPGAFGGIETEGESNTPELVERLAYITDVVTQEDVVKDMPPVRREKEVVRREHQDKGVIANGMAEVRSLLRGTTEDQLTGELMLAASLVRGKVLTDVEEALLGGLKIVVFTGLQLDAEYLGSEIAKLVKKLEAPHRPQPWHGWCHGGQPTSIKARHDLCQAFIKHPGAAVLAATGFSIGESIDLPGVDILEFAMLPPTPEHLIQWEGRSTGLRQRGAVLVRYLAAEGTRSERVIELLVSKLPDVNRLARDDTAAQMCEALKSCGMSEDELFDLMVSGMKPGGKEWRVR